MNENEMQSAPDGIYLGVQPVKTAPPPAWDLIFRAVFALALTVGIIGAFFSMLELPVRIETVAAGGTVFAVTFAFAAAGGTNKKIRISVAAVSLAAVAAAIFFRGEVVGGMKIICNRFFDVSEKYQLYEYDRFTVTADEKLYAGYTVAANILIAAAVSLPGVAAAAKKNAVLTAVIAALFAGVQIYFGIFPAPLWNILLYSAFAMALLNGSNTMTFRFGAAFAAVLAVAVAAAHLVYSGANPALSETSEALRDYFGTKTERTVTGESSVGGHSHMRQSEEPIQLNPNAAENGDGTENDGEKYHVGREYEFSGASAGAAGAFKSRLWILFLFIAMIFASLGALCVYRTARRRAKFNSVDHAAAIDCMFGYAMDLIIKFGVKPLNVFYTKYFERIKAAVSPAYAEDYLAMADLWEEAVYSEHSMTSEQRDKMKLFLSATKRALYRKSNLVQGMKIKFYCLYNSRR